MRERFNGTIMTIHIGIAKELFKLGDVLISCEAQWYHAPAYVPVWLLKLRAFVSGIGIWKVLEIETNSITVGVVSLPKKRRVTFSFVWHDFWVGLYYNRPRALVYVAPLPMCIFKIKLRY